MMRFSTLLLVGLLGANAENMGMQLRKVSEPSQEVAGGEADTAGEVAHLDLEVILEGGERKLFPLLPGVSCPPKMTCRTRNSVAGLSPMASALKKNLKKPLAMAMDWGEFNGNLKTVVASDQMCTRRAAMSRAAGMAAGLSVAAVSKPAYAAETKEVKMGTDGGGLQFVPSNLKICVGDSVKWINNKAGPHNVVFDEDAIPKGVSQEAISMEDQLGDEGDTFERTFKEPGTYEYYCEPHRGAGMNGQLTVV